jgi:hypothetical protein
LKTDIENMSYQERSYKKVSPEENRVERLKEKRKGGQRTYSHDGQIDGEKGGRICP